MKIAIRQGDIATVAADLIIVNLFQGVTHPGGRRARWIGHWGVRSAM